MLLRHFQVVLPVLFLVLFSWLSGPSQSCVSDSCLFCVALLPFLPPQFPLYIMGQGMTAYPAQGGQLQVLLARSPGGSRWQELLVTDISPQLISEWAENNVVSCCFTTTSALCALLQNPEGIKVDTLYWSHKRKFRSYTPLFLWDRCSKWDRVRRLTVTCVLNISTLLKGTLKGLQRCPGTTPATNLVVKKNNWII